MKTPTYARWLVFPFLVTICFVQNCVAQDKHVGKVVFAGDAKLVISDIDDTSEAFIVPDDAKITRNGKVANLSDLAAGDAVVVTAVRKETKLVANVIAATSGM